MALDLLMTVEITEALENFLDRNRPEQEIRSKVDLSYRVQNQSVIVFEIRPQWNQPEKIIECPIAKATYIKSSDRWKIFWINSNNKWLPYSPQPVIKKIQKFTKILESDKTGCFWG